jgi:hypothetical protein
MQSSDSTTPTTGLTADQKRIVHLVIERAEQACRYVLKHQDFTEDDTAYAQGFEGACSVCENAIREHVMRHVAEDISK